MGDPKKLKKIYTPSAHPWIRSEIEEKKALCQEYGLKNRRELLIASSFLKKYKDIAKRLVADKTVQGEIEKKQMLTKLQKLGLIAADATLDDILGLQLKNLLDRRLQSLVYRKDLARSIRQARQFIAHRHILINEKEITSPSCLIGVEDEPKIVFKPGSSLSSENHPERISPDLAQKIKTEAETIRLEKRAGKETGKKPVSKARKGRRKEGKPEPRKPARKAKAEN